MNVRLRPSRAGLNRAERDIAPPMRQAITIPLGLDPARGVRNVTLYVVQSPFGDEPVGPNEFRGIALEVLARLEAGEPKGGA